MLQKERAETYERLLRAFIGLQGNHDFAAIVTWFEEMEVELNRTWCDAKGEQAAWMQGRKQIVQAFNEYRKEAPERLATLLHGKAKTSAIKREVKKDAIYG
jgi:hypothetical protein